MNNDILLSICIPTYNRSKYLHITLMSLFQNPEFDNNKIEVIVSDNCSTDQTAEIVKLFPYVRYYRNTENINDKNFFLVLSYARGKYIKLFNDTLSFTPNSLKYLLQTIKKNVDSETNLFFYKNQFNNQNCIKLINNKVELLNELSYLTTWIANFGTWKTNFDMIIDEDKYSNLQFSQVDWTYQLINMNKIEVHFGNFFEVNEVEKKGGYNVFDTFINKYLYIIKTNNFSFISIEIEKYKLFKHFVYPWMITLLIKNKENYSFDTSKSITIILKKYWYTPYFYLFFVFFWFKKIKY